MKPEQFTEKRIIQIRSEVACIHFLIAQIRSSDITGKKCIARKQSHRSARLEQTQANAIRRVTRCCDDLYLHTPQGYSIAVSEVEVGKNGGCSLGKQNGRAGLG
jgi:hypothetical protein